MPDRKLRLQSSGIRNFLISLGLLKYDSIKDVYFVSKEKSRYLNIIFNKNTLTPLQLSKKLAENEKIGSAAELVVIRYEKQRLKLFSNLSEKIKHIAKGKVNAGYDIESFSIETPKRILPRYIEVKAVSFEDWKFFWSRNEMTMAKLLGGQYYLYLVPVKNKNSFDIKSMKIIQDPYKNILQNKNWGQEIELKSFTLNKTL
jgi:hypothetical protein